MLLVTVAVGRPMEATTMLIAAISTVICYKVDGGNRCTAVAAKTKNVDSNPSSYENLMDSLN